MNLPMFFRQMGDFVGKNSQTILTYFSVGGLVGTTVFSIRATTKADMILLDLREKYGNDIPKDVLFRKIAPLYIPTVIMGGLTAASIIGSSKSAAKQSAVLASSLYSAEMALKEYQAKVVETIGEKKELTVREGLAGDQIARNPVSRNQIFITGRGDHLCYDTLSGRYFKSDIEKLRQLQNEMNRCIISEMWVTLNQVYMEMGLDPIELGNDVGWNVDHMLDMQFSGHLTDDQQPCIAVVHSVQPRLYRF